MNKCENCIHQDICEMFDVQSVSDESPCSLFKDKANFMGFPCKVGDIANAEFIVHARADIPSLIAEIKDLKAEQPVRCYQCKHFLKSKMLKKGICRNSKTPFYLDGLLIEVNPNDFCSYGERAEDEK